MAQEGRGWRRGVAAVPRGLRYMAGAAFFFSVMSLLVKVAGQRLPTQEVVLARSSVGAFLSWAVLRRRGIGVLGSRRLLLFARAALGYGALSCFFYALVHLPLADATVIQYTNPIWTGLLAAVVLGERMRTADVALVAVSLAGVALMTRPGFLFGGAGHRLDLTAAAIALLGAILSAAAYVTVRKLSRTEDPLVIVFWFASVSTVAAIPFTAASAVLPTAREWLALAGIGVVTQLGQVFMTHGLRLEKAGRVMAVGYMQIVFAALWGVLFFAELPDVWGVGGALLIVVGTLGIARRPAETEGTE